MVNLGTPCSLLGSFGLVGFSRSRPRGCRFHSGSLGSFGRAMV